MKAHDYITDAEMRYWQKWRGAVVSFAHLTMRAAAIEPGEHDMERICYDLFRSMLEHEHEKAGATADNPGNAGLLHAARAVDIVQRAIAFNMTAIAQVYGILPITAGGNK